jgi:hypothetical protein
VDVPRAAARRRASGIGIDLLSGSAAGRSARGRGGSWNEGSGHPPSRRVRSAPPGRSRGRDPRPGGPAGATTGCSRMRPSRDVGARGDRELHRGPEHEARGRRYAPRRRRWMGTGPVPRAVRRRARGTRRGRSPRSHPWRRRRLPATAPAAAATGAAESHDSDDRLCPNPPPRDPRPAGKPVGAIVNPGLQPQRTRPVVPASSDGRRRPSEKPETARPPSEHADRSSRSRRYVTQHRAANPA